MRFRRPVVLALLSLAAAAALAFWYRGAFLRREPVTPNFGVTFSVKYARELGLDWKAAYAATLDELQIRRLRIPVYWDESEPERGRHVWDDVRWMLDEADKRGAEVILAVGRKTPRWPECHVPTWAKGLPVEEQDARTLDFLRAEIEEFKGHPAVRTWQVENEALFRFGECPPPDRALLREEIRLVRSLDARPILVTDSGELSTWLRAAPLGDGLGISLYRRVRNRVFGELLWPVSPLVYADRMRLIRPLAGNVIVSELQAEPWFSRPVAETPLDEQFRQMDPQRLRDNLDYAVSTGASEIYLWGVEWWYWVRTQGNDGLWKAAQALLS